MDEFGRPHWDDWYLAMCLVISQRSLDGSTKHGSIVVGKHREVLSIGYNSPPRGCCDKDIPQSRPAKYLFMEHSESNAILNAARTGVSLDGSTFYITGFPCVDCVRKIINVGAIRVVYGEVGALCINNDQIEAIQIMLKSQNIEFCKIMLDKAEAVLGKAKLYSETKKQETVGLICNSIKCMTVI